MFSYKASDVNEALRYGLEYLLHAGVEESSRNGLVIVAPGPVLVEYTNPRQRVLYSPARDCNPVFHLMESLWMLAGEWDIEFPVFFNSTYGQFSDDNKVMWDAYGHRWRNFFGWDQLDGIMEELKKNPTSRRCVLAMWNSFAQSDFDHPLKRKEEQWCEDFGLACDGGKAVPCLGGETVLWSPEGGATLRELALEFKTGKLTRWPVFTFDTKTKQQTMQWCTKVWCTGKRKLFKITFDDGSMVRVTANHKFFIKKFRNKEFCEEITVGTLKPGDRVWASEVWETAKGYLASKLDVSMKRAWGINEVKVHNAYYQLLHGTLPEGVIVHHNDEDKQNNVESNLKPMTVSEHNAYHRLGARNPMRKMLPKQREAKGAEHSIVLKDNWAKRTPKARRQHSKATSAGLIKSYTRQRESNHVVMSIIECGLEDVYDFEVPVNHNAMLSNGVITHNCNTQAYFAIRAGKLNMTVMNRSNDLIWGMLGANAVHFSLLLEYMAMRIGVPIGSYYQFTNNLHVYTDKMSREKMEQVADECAAVGELPETGVLLNNGFDSDLKLFMPWAMNVIRSVPEKEGVEVATNIPELQTEFMWSVVVPMFLFWVYRKWKDEYSSNIALDGIAAPDWQRACREWSDRRKKA